MVTPHLQPATREDAERALTGPGGAFEVVVEEVLGTPMKVYKDRPRALPELFDSGTSRGQHAEHIVYGDQRIRFPSFRAQVNGLSAMLRDRHSLRHGDRVAVLSANSPEWVMTFWATTNLGCVLVGLNGWWKADEIRYSLDDSGAKVLVADRPRFDRIANEMQRLPELEAIYVVGELPDSPDPRVRSFDDLLGVADATPRVPIDEDDAAVIFYTSGTTGRPKGAISSHRSMIANVQSTALNNLVERVLAEMERSEPSLGMPPQPVVLLSSPMFHVSGCHSGLVVGLASAAKLVIPVGRFEPQKALRLIQDERVSVWPTVPTMAWRVSEDPTRHDYDTSSVRSIAYGGSPTAAELQRRIRETFPNVRKSLRNAYGLTETSSVATVNSGQDLIDRPDSVGRPTPLVEVKVVDSDGAEVPTGQTGEVWIRGPIVMPGYWRNPVATHETITADRWLRTGDIGRLDADSFLYITDRTKDMIIRGGENVYSVEIENRLVEHPAIADAAVIGIPHPSLGEVVKAIVQVEPGHVLDADAVKAWVAEKLADFKVPEVVEIRTENLPRNASGKLLKDVLRGSADVPLTETL